MKKVEPILLIIFVMVCALKTQAQNIQGKISNNQKYPIEDVYLVNLNNGTHTHSDEVGNFNLKHSNIGDSIRITYAGYKTQIIVATSNNLHITLQAATYQLNEVVVNQGINHLSSLAAVDLKINPVNSSQELLRKVPGLFIGQHAGGGKAEQLFLRGFDLDHGTDINITVDGMPVNMVSHAHGQGYADLHFVIPETVANIDFDKGPYHASKGNMATAGYVAFKTKDRLENNSITAEIGKFNTYKTLAMFNFLNNANQAAYVALDYLATDNYFESPQNFHRFNAFGKYTHNYTTDKISIAASHFTSKWNASGQIPQRAVDAGLITRFGAIDDQEGGTTNRTNFNFQMYNQLNANAYLKTNAFYSNYNFELFSNFTFYLNNPNEGDQIKQQENRNIAGFETLLNKNTKLGTADFTWQAGVGLRYDNLPQISLTNTFNRIIEIQKFAEGKVNELNSYTYLNGELALGKWLINPGVRVDYLQSNYQDLLNAPAATIGKTIVSPKLNFLYTANKDLQFFLKLGKGFHSNDTRVVTATSGLNILPAAYGADAGIILKPAARIILNAAAWYLYLDQEFVYVGDEAVVEPSGRTARKGIDLGLRWQLNDWLFLNTDLTYTHARTLNEPPGENYIPLAPKFTFTGGLSAQNIQNFSGSVRSRFLANRAANADNSSIAKGYFLTDANVNYTYKNFIFGILTENIFNHTWNETQFETTSRLKNELAPVSEIHFTPGTPFNIRASITFKF